MVPGAVYFVDLDGVNDGRTASYWSTEAAVAQTVHHRVCELEGSVARSRLAEFVARADVGTRLHLALDPCERHAALTVNEFETLLMKNDLADAGAATVHGRAVPGVRRPTRLVSATRPTSCACSTLGSTPSACRARSWRRCWRGPCTRASSDPCLLHLLVAGARGRSVEAPTISYSATVARRACSTSESSRPRPQASRIAGHANLVSRALRSKKLVYPPGRASP